MKRTHILKLCMLLVGIIAMWPQTANATHFRYSTFSWERVAGQPNQIRFRISQAWRRSYFGSPQPVVGSTVTASAFNPGQGSSINIPLVITSVNAPEDWVYGEYSFIKTYTGPGTYTASIDGCCRISTLGNNSDRDFRVISTVTVGNNNDAPISTMPPFVNLPVNTATAQYQIPATDPNGDALTFSLVPNGQFGAATVQPTGVAISSSGLLTFNTIGRAVGSLWNVALYVTDARGARIQLDLMIRVTTPSTPPVFDYTVTPNNNINYVIQPGQNLSFNLRATDVDAGDNLILSAVGLPIGSTFVPSAPGNPVLGSFSWTPTLANVGSYQVNFIAQDFAGIQTSTIVNIAVSTRPNFIAPSLMNGSILCYRPGDTIRQIYIANDVDTGDRVRLSLMTSPKPGMSFSPVLPTVQANPTSTNFTWMTSSANWGLNMVVVRATDKYSETRDDSVTYIVNTPPLFATTQNSTTVFAGQLFSYTFSGTDADIPVGDSIMLSHMHIPAWMTITDNNNGTWTLSGTPAISDSGDHHVTLQIQDKTNHYNGTHCGDATQNFTLTVLPCNVIASTTVTNVLCNGAATGAVDLTLANATAPITYAWSNSATTEDLAGVTAGTYSVSVVDANGCTASTSATVTEPTALIASATGTNNICNGGSIGSADLTVSGGTPPYSYLWTNTATMEDISGLTAGTYSVTVTDNNGCTAITSYTVTEPTAVIASIAGTNNLCYGQSAGAADLTVSGGTPGYTYSWSNGATTEDINGLAAGTYSVMVTDANGCTANASYTVTEPTQLVATTTGTNNLCFGGTSGTVDLTVNGGTPAYTYLWSNGATTEDLGGLAAGTYSVTVTDANGCTANASYTVTQPATPLSGTITVSPVQTIPGQASYTIFVGYGPQSVTLSATASGGTPGYTYSWSPATGLANPNSATTSASPTTTTTYVVTITDANGCVKSVSRTIFVVDVRCGNKNDKVSICHNGHTICVSPNAVSDHLSHGDYLGNCNSGNKTAGNNEENINDLVLENAVKVYPNPNNGSFSVEMPSNVTNTEVYVIDMAGKVIEHRSGVNEHTIHFDLGNVASGVYMVHIVSGKNTYQSKVTVQ